MFGLSRFFRPRPAPARQGLTAGEVALFELLDLALLTGEAETARALTDNAARPAARLKQARICLELARRTGDAVTLRRAASSAELAAKEFETGSAPWAAARLEQALCALAGAELFGDDGLNAAAERVVGELAEFPAPTGPRARAIALRIEARRALDRGDALDALAALTGFDAITNALNSARAPDELTLVQCRTDRAELTLESAILLNDDRLMARAAADLGEVIERIDYAYLPVSWCRATRLRAEALTALGHRKGDIKPVAEAVESLSRLFDVLLRDHSPVGWAKAQAAHGAALWRMAEITSVEDAWSRASGAYDRAWTVLRDLPSLRLRAEVGERRGALAIRCAEHHADRLEFDAVEAGFRCDLAKCDPELDPVGWGVCQLNLGRLYLSREAITGGRGKRGGAEAAVALAEAREVLGEHGLGRLVTTSVASPLN